jgi:hypothetical protein
VSALALLIRLQLRGWARYLVRGLATVKGASLALVGLLFFAGWIGQFFLVPRHEVRADPTVLLLYGPAFLLGWCVLNALLTSGERALYFSPAEVNFLFPGPFSRRQVLAYKLLSTFLLGLPATLILMLILQVHANWWVAAYVALLLAFAFMQLFAVAVSQFAVNVGARLYSRGRRLAVAALALGIVLALVWERGAWSSGQLVQWFREVQQGDVWKTLTAPLRWFFEAFLTGPGDWGRLLVYSVLCLGVDAVLLAIVFLLDADYLEVAASSSARIYAQLQRYRGRPAPVGGDGQPASGPVRFTLPSLPWLGGVGPTLWRQLTTALRNWGRLVLALVVLGMFVMGPVIAGTRLAPPGQEVELEGLAVALGAMVLFVSMLLTGLIPFDFRGDVDRIAVLKALPLASWRLALGEVLASVVVLTLLQWLAMAAVGVVLGEAEPLLLLFGVFAVPFNFLLFALENLLFLLFPTRLTATTPGDFQALGRNVVLLLAKLLLLLVILAVAGLAIVAVYLALGVVANFSARLGRPLEVSLAPALYVGWFVLAAAGAALVPLVAWAFDRFDVGRDTPA